jgi:hypothetical protein
MLHDFYNCRMISVIILVWIVALIGIALAVCGAYRFFQVETTKHQIMYATIFLVGVHWVSMIKIFAWQMIHRNAIKRDLNNLQSQIAELKKNQ